MSTPLPEKRINRICQFCIECKAKSNALILHRNSVSSQYARETGGWTLPWLCGDWCGWGLVWIGADVGEKLRKPMVYPPPLKDSGASGSLRRLSGRGAAGWGGKRGRGWVVGKQSSRGEEGIAALRCAALAMTRLSCLGAAAGWAGKHVRRCIQGKQGRQGRQSRQGGHRFEEGRRVLEMLKYSRNPGETLQQSCRLPMAILQII